MRVSEKKSEKDCDSDEMNEKYYKTPHITPEFLMWTVSMLRTSQKQGHQTQQVAVVHSGLENEWNRVATFSQFQPPAGVYIIPITSAGFFLPSYAESLNNSEAKVECAFCGVLVLITEFGKGRRAMDVHRWAAPHCSFVLNQSVGNVSIARTAGAKFLNKYSSGLGGGEYSPPPPPPPPLSVCVCAFFFLLFFWVGCFSVTLFLPKSLLLCMQFLCVVFFVSLWPLSSQRPFYYGCSFCFLFQCDPFPDEDSFTMGAVFLSFFPFSPQWDPLPAKDCCTIDTVFCCFSVNRFLPKVVLL